MNLPPDVAIITAALLQGIQMALGDDLVGLYLHGSLATGNFDPATSDIDFFAITARPITASQFAALAALHQQLAAFPHPYGNHLEGPYIEQDAARRFVPNQHYPAIQRGEALAWVTHGTNWILERFVVVSVAASRLGGVR